MTTTSSHISCACCFGASILTPDGKSSIECPICNGGKIQGLELQNRNIHYLNGRRHVDEEQSSNEEDLPYYDNNEY